FELGDGATCYVTHLWPMGKFAALSLRDGDDVSKIQFRTQSRIEARFFAGKGERSAYFMRIDGDKIKIEQLPILCLAIPSGYFKETETVLNKKFQVFSDSKQAFGKWEKCPVHGDDDKEFYIWNWSKQPFIEKMKSGTTKSFRQLAGFFGSPDLKGERTLSIESPEFKVRYKIYLEHSKRGMGECWKNLPGAFLPFFLLCQSTEGMRWEDLM